MGLPDLPGERAQLARQIGHWTAAAERLRALDDLAAPSAWAGLERYLGVAVRSALSAAVDRLIARGTGLRTGLRMARTLTELTAVRRELLAYRQSYLRTELTVDFYADAVNTRTNPRIAALLRACDSLAHRSMALVLDPLRKPVPVTLTYVDSGVGAAILKAGLRLWDEDTLSPVAAVKIVRHGLLCPTSLIHESGHQVAHLTGWNTELTHVLQRLLAGSEREVAEAWSSWTSEITADVFAFAHTGYAAVANLHDVLAGGERLIFRMPPGDPHPVGYLRVLLNTAMCRHVYGAGPWDTLETAWRGDHPVEACADPDVRSLVSSSLPLLPDIAATVLDAPLAAFGGRPLTSMVPPERVAPQALGELADRLGPALYTSPHWLWTEGLRLLALSGLRAATSPEQVPDVSTTCSTWMSRLGGEEQAA